ncbi:FG-GAP-like repeat-containing protein [Streptomyces sp. NPDC046261]|uniref:FG-GAP-like repeat-containing protein n=1 Tax=Streptomyces sp. NPDC046261 TaxID=3157200 RepID=UPI00340B7E11
MSARRPRVALIAGLIASGVAAGLLTAAPSHAVVGSAAEDGSYAFTAKLDIGNGKRSCSAALVEQQWLVTAASCFAENPAQGLKVTAGAPQWKTTATIGRADLTRDTGSVVEVVELVPRDDRDLVLARLATPAAGITPIDIATHKPVAGEELRVTGYGRTEDEWVPDRLHSAGFTIGATGATSLDLTGKSPGAAICKGDTGGPAFRDVGGRFELAAVHSRSWQGGCFGEDESRSGAVETRVDDVNYWVRQVISRSDTAKGANKLTVSGDFDGDGRADTAAMYGYDDGSMALFTFRSTPDGGFEEPVKSWSTKPGQWAFKNVKQIVAGDFNGDGRSDLATMYGYDDGSVALFTFLSEPDGTFRKETKSWNTKPGQWAFKNAKQIVAGDFNGDGRSDLATMYGYDDGSVALFTFLSEPDGTFRKETKSWNTKPGQWDVNNVQMAAGDFDGNGRADIAAFYGYGDARAALFTFLSEPDGTFRKENKSWNAPANSWWGRNMRIVAGDFDGNGRADIGAMYGYGDGSVALFTFPSDPDGGFGTPVKSWNAKPGEWNAGNVQLVTGDYNRDGRADLATFYSYGNDKSALFTFTSESNGAFQAPVRSWSVSGV